MNLSELGRSAFSLWWPGAALFAILLLYFLARPQKLPEGSRRQSVAQTSAAFLAYSILCLAIALSKHYFLATSHFVALALAMLAASSFLVGLYFEKAKPLMKVTGLMLLVTAASASYGNWFPQNEGGFSPTKEVKRTVYDMTSQQLIDEGEKIIFGGIGQNNTQGAIGRGQCPLCHLFQKDMLSNRAPNLYGITGTASERLKDPRYHLGKPQGRDTVQKEAYLGSGTATNELEYIAESLICPSCYVVAGYGTRGTNDLESPGIKLHKPPVSLTFDDFIAVTTWLYAKDGQRAPSQDEIELAFKNFIPPIDWNMVSRQGSNDPASAPIYLLATGLEPLDDIFTRAQCVACHVIPGIGAPARPIGPKLTMKSVAPLRLKDPTYKGGARNTREYVIESILYPSAYIAKGFPDNTMPKVFGTKLTGLAIDRMADYLSQLEEGNAPPKID